MERVANDNNLLHGIRHYDKSIGQLSRWCGILDWKVEVVERCEVYIELVLGLLSLPPSNLFCFTDYYVLT